MGEEERNSESPATNIPDVELEALVNDGLDVESLRSLGKERDARRGRIQGV